MLLAELSSKWSHVAGGRQRDFGAKGNTGVHGSTGLQLRTKVEYRVAAATLFESNRNHRLCWRVRIRRNYVSF